MKHLEPLNLNLVLTSGNSLVVRRVSPGMIIVLFWTKYVVPHQIKLRIIHITIRRGQSTICIVFICVSYAENDYHHVISAGQLRFHRRTYYGRSCCMSTFYGLAFHAFSHPFSYIIPFISGHEMFHADDVTLKRSTDWLSLARENSSPSNNQSQTLHQSLWC